jgi:hypothetical protein
MSQLHPNPNALSDWGWKTAAGFIVTGTLGLFVLTLKWSLPVLGERAYRMFGERAFKAEWATLTRTSETVQRIEPIVTHSADHLARVEEQMNNGFLAIHEVLNRLSEQVFALARER